VVIALVAPAERFIAFGWQAISDAAWSEFACMLTYKQGWRGGQTTSAERCFPSSKTCSKCGTVKATMSLAERTFGCDACGLSLDRDLNAAINLATWAERHSIGADAQVRDPEARGPVTNAHRGDGSGPRTRAGETSSNDVGTQTQTHAA
jgi:putative transposase